MKTIEEKILSIIDRMAEADPGRNLPRYRDQILREITSRNSLQDRRGHIVNKFGVQVDLKEIVSTFIDSATYIPRPSDHAEKMKYVSPWAKPTAEQRQKMSNEVYQVLEHLVSTHKVQAADKNAFQKALKTLSENMAYGFNDEGKIVFAKANPNGLFGSQEFTFDELMQSVRHLVDEKATSLEKELDMATRREVAKKILNKPNAKDEIVNAKISELVDRDVMQKVPRRILPRLPKSLLETEFYRREAILRGVDPSVTGGNVGHQIGRAAKQEMEKIDDVSDIQRQLQQIQPNTVTPWEGVSYE